MTGFLFCALTILLANVVIVHSEDTIEIPVKNDQIWTKLIDKPLPIKPYTIPVKNDQIWTKLIGKPLPIKPYTFTTGNDLYEQMGAKEIKCSLANNTWSGRSLTYKISDFIRQRDAFLLPHVKKAVATWSDYADVNLTRTMTDEADIIIEYYSNDYKSLYLFINTLIDADVIADDIYIEALGQIGNALGLLNPEYECGDHKRVRWDCEDEIKKEWCRDLKIDTIFTDYRGDTYVFKGYRYLRLYIADLYNGRSQPIAHKWRGLPGNIDAAFTNKKNNRTLFFKHTTVWSYTEETLDPGFPQDIRVILGDRFTHFDDIVYHNNELLMFVGDSYWIYSFDEKTVSEAKSISELGVPNDIDAAFEFPNGEIYFFKGDKYYELNFEKRIKNKEGAPLIPKSTKEIFLSCTRY